MSSESSTIRILACSVMTFWQFPPRSILRRQEKSKNTMLANCLSPRRQGTHGVSRQNFFPGRGCYPLSRRKPTSTITGSQLALFALAVVSFLLDSLLLFALFYEWLAAGSIDPVIWWLVMIVRTGIYEPGDSPILTYGVLWAY